MTLILLVTSLALYILFPALLHFRPSRDRGSTTDSSRSHSFPAHDRSPHEKLSNALARDSRSKPLQPPAFLFLSAACFTSLVTAVWQHVGAVSARNMIQDVGAAIMGAETGGRIMFPGPGLGAQSAVNVAVGRRAIALGWEAAVMICLAEAFSFAGMVLAEKMERGSLIGTWG